MAFVLAMNALQQRTQGVNGADVYTADGIGDIRVALYTSLVRGLGRADIKEFIAKAVAEGTARGKEAEYERDLWLIAFQGRDVRGGKGERTAAITMLEELCLQFGSRTESMLRLWAEYGCWRDLFVIANESVSLEAWVLKVVSEQFWADWTAHKAGKPFSLLAKWMPREGSALDIGSLVGKLARVMYHTLRDPASRRTIYRRHVAKLSSTLKVVERDMCGGTWAKIKPGSVPGRCLNLNRKAFLNEKLKGSGERCTTEDRRTCAANFKEHLSAVLAGRATVKGGETVFPHTICRQVSVHLAPQGEEMQLLEAQWAAIRDKVKAAGAMGRVVPMCDFSGSMSGTPMEVSMALGILLSEVNHPAFKNHMLSFDSQPHWIKFREDMRLYEKCYEAMRHGQGLSTNFEAAMQLVLDRLVEHNVPACEAPEDIVVFTDMGFDAACGRGRQAGQWSTLVTNMKSRFRAAGYIMPRLVIWNLRAAYKEYHAKVDEQGVLMLSGWSPSSMKIIMQGIKVQTPYEGMRAVLDDARYDAVRAALT